MIVTKIFDKNSLRDRHFVDVINIVPFSVFKNIKHDVRFQYGYIQYITFIVEVFNEETS